MGAGCNDLSGSPYDYVFEPGPGEDWTAPDSLDNRISATAVKGVATLFRRNVQNAESDMVTIAGSGEMVWTQHTQSLNGATAVYMRFGTCEAK